MKRIAVGFLVLSTLCGSAAPAEPEGMFALYQNNRTQNLPNYITEDFLLLSHMMILDRATVEFEETTAAPALAQLARGLTAALAAQPGDVALARDFAAILAALASGDRSGIPAGGEVAAELQRIHEAKGIQRSPLFRQTIDYSQFQVRGRYSKDEKSANYFRSYRYAGAVLFPVLESQATSIGSEDADLLTSQAIVLSRAILGSTELSRAYADLTARITFLFGPSDDLTPADLVGADLAAGASAARAQLLALGKRPRVIGSVVETAKLEPSRTVFDVLTGFRLLPQTFSADAAALGALTFPSAGDFRGKGQPFTLGVVAGQKKKVFPAAAELLALMGSEAARKELSKKQETAYADYETAFGKARGLLQSAEGLPSSHLQLMGAWVRNAPKGSDARRMQSALAYWTHYRHSGLLYIKQSYTAEGKGIELAHPRAGAWIETAPELYLLLRRQADQVYRVAPSPWLQEWEAALDRCIDVSYAALREGQLTESQEAFLNDLDMLLLRLTGRADRPIVVDIHTDPNSGLVVEEGIGFPLTAKAPNGTATGALFSHQEFKQPLQQRLTDESWMERLRNRSKTTTSKESELP